MKIKALKGITTTQERTYQGLAEISELIAGLYLDAVMIMREQCMLQAKVNLVAHCAREIDGGLRDIFAPAEAKKSVEKTLSGENKGHHASILIALGNTDKSVAAEWLDIATKFAGLAHRHYAWAQLRDISEIAYLWQRYEKILLLLAGSAYAIRDRIDQLTSLDVPNPAIIGALQNLNRGEKNQFQFFRTLDKVGWFQPLDEAGMFDLKSVKPFYDQQGRWILSDWLPLSYLARIAPAVNGEQETRLVAIIDSLKTEVNAGRLLLDDASLYHIYHIVADLPAYRFNASDAAFLNQYTRNFPTARYPMHESVLAENLVERYVSIKDVDALSALLVYCFGFYHYEEKIEGLEEHGIYAQHRVEPNIGSMYIHHLVDVRLPEIIALTGPSLPDQLAGIIDNLQTMRSYELNSLPSVEHSEQSDYYTHDWVSNLADFLRAGAELLKGAELLEFISGLWERPALFHQRLALHLVRLNYQEAGPQFWDWLRRQPLNGHFPIHELYLLFKEISPLLTAGELKELLAWLDAMIYNPVHDPAIDTEPFKAHRIRSYLTAIQVTGDERKHILQAIQDKYDEIDQWPLEHLEFDTYTTSSVGYDIPLKLGEFEELSATDQAAYIGHYEGKDKYDTTPQGLSLLLEQNIIRDTAKYQPALDKIIGLSELYLGSAIGGFTQALKNGTLTYREELTEQLAARLFRGDSQQPTMTAFAGYLMETAEQQEKLHLSAEQLERHLELSIQLLTMTKYQTPKPIPLNDFSNQRLNGLYGKAFDALVWFNQLWTKAAERKGLHPSFKDYLEKHLIRTTEFQKEFSIGLGFHFPYLLSADPDWTENNAASIFPQGSRIHMGYTLGSLFSPLNDVYKSVLGYFTRHGLNAYAVDRYQEEGAELNRVARYAVVELLYIDPKAIDRDGSLINLFLKAQNPVQLKAVVLVAAKQEFAPAAPVLELWTKLQHIAEKSPADHLPLLESIAGLAFLIPLEQSALNLLEAAGPYLVAGPLANRLIGLLSRSPEIGAERAVQLILIIWKKTLDRVWVSDDLARFVENLYHQDKNEIADEICIYAAEKGDFRLKEVYDRNQVQSITRA